MIVVTLYNEEADKLHRTLEGIAMERAHFFPEEFKEKMQKIGKVWQQKSRNGKLQKNQEKHTEILGN